MKLYINNHVQDQYDTRAKGMLNLQGVHNMKVLVQREKNGLKINQLKGCFKVNGVYLIANLYKNKHTDALALKGLTVLTQKQMELSRNFGCGNHLKTTYNMKIDNIEYEEKFFDYNDYNDFFKTYNWSEDDVVELNF